MPNGFPVHELCNCPPLTERLAPALCLGCRAYDPCACSGSMKHVYTISPCSGSPPTLSAPPMPRTPLQAFAPWFLLPPPVVDVGHGAPHDPEDDSPADAACSSCGLPHAEPSKLASLFFALQTFSSDIGLSTLSTPDGHHHVESTTATPCPVRCIAFEGVTVRFAQHEDDSVPITAALLTSRELDVSCAEDLVRSIVAEFVRAHPARLGHTVKATRYRSFGATLRGLLRTSALTYAARVGAELVGMSSMDDGSSPGTSGSYPWWLTVLAREDRMDTVLTPWRLGSKTSQQVPVAHIGDGKVAQVTLPALVSPHSGSHTGPVSGSSTPTGPTPGMDGPGPKPRWWQRRTGEPSHASSAGATGPTLVPTRPSTSSDSSGPTRGVGGRIKRMFRTSAPAATAASAAVAAQASDVAGTTRSSLPSGAVGLKGGAGVACSDGLVGATRHDQHWWLTTLTASASPSSAQTAALATAALATDAGVGSGLGVGLPWLQAHLWGTGGDAVSGVMYQTHCVHDDVVCSSGLGPIVGAGGSVDQARMGGVLRGDAPSVLLRTPAYASTQLAEDGGVRIVVTLPIQLGVLDTTGRPRLMSLARALQQLLPYADLT